MEPKTGSVVISKAGRDKGKFLAVVRTDGKSVYVADGGERPLERPKRKNRIHLTVTHYELSPADTASNRSLKKALNKIQFPEK